jgi:hypothetical protein
MYGWRRREALGRISHELLETEFPGPLEAIEAELASRDRWAGELVQSTRAGRSSGMSRASRSPTSRSTPT